MPVASRAKNTKPILNINATLQEVELVFEEADSLADETIERVKSQAVRDIFGPGANPKRRYVADLSRIAQYSSFLKGLGLRVVYTQGVWDLPHIGHCRYLQQAKQHGDILIVGSELDAAVNIRKGPKRPVVPFSERIEFLCHIRHVDLVVPIPDYDSRGLSGMKVVEAIRPNTFIASERSFREYTDTKAWVGRVKKYCDQVEILESLAETSTSAKIRALLMDMGEHTKNTLNEARISAMKALEQSFEEVKQRIDDAVRKA